MVCNLKYRSHLNAKRGRSLPDCLNPKACQEAACGSGARTTSSTNNCETFTRTHTDAMRRIRQKSKSNQRTKSTQQQKWSRGRAGEGGTHFFLGMQHVAWADFHTPRRISLVHASSKQSQRPREKASKIVATITNNKLPRIPLPNPTSHPSRRSLPWQQQQLFDLFNFGSSAAGTRRLERIGTLPSCVLIALENCSYA